MFTGIIETTAKIIENTGNRLVLERPAIFDDIKLGSSIAVSGACLSVVAFDDHSMRFDVVEETLQKTKLGELKIGDSVNLERSMKASDRFEGHVVQGHVEGKALVTSYSLARPKLTSEGGLLETRDDPSSATLTIELPENLVPNVVSKGSIAIDGVSLTVASIEGNLCTIAIIPHTLKITTLENLREKDHVNIETDILARYSRSSH